MTAEKRKKRPALPKKPAATETAAVLPRRNFLMKLWFGLGLVAVGELVWIVTSFLRPRRSPTPDGDFGAIVTAGPVDGFPRNSVTAFPRGHFYLARLADGGFLAISRRCTHLGCTVPWIAEDNQFLCPCHSSAFDIRGAVIRAPAPRPLDIYPLTIENEVVRVDTGRTIRRSGFKPEQVTYGQKGAIKG